jgi:hypothetical protein
MFYLDQACRDAGVKLRQCWFPGYHSCVGGESSPKYKVNSVDEVSLAWMIDQLTLYNLLSINKRALRYPILDRLSKSMPPLGHRPEQPRSTQEVHEKRIDWSDGQLIETQTLFWNVASQVATERWEYIRKPGQYHATDPYTRQEIDQSAFKETIHPCVWHRIQTRNYEPRCLPLSSWKRRRTENGGYEWTKASKSGYIQVIIPEYVIPNIPERDTLGMELWTGCLEQRIAPGDFLEKLDRSNGIVRGAGQRPRTVSRIDSGYGSGEYDDNFLSPTVSRVSKDASYEEGYRERETITIRSTSPRPPSRVGGEAAEYYDSTTVYEGRY